MGARQSLSQLTRVETLEAEVGASWLTSGVETLNRLYSFSNTVAQTNGILRLNFFTAHKAFTSTQARMFCGAVAAVTPTLIRWGLYTVAANGDGTLVASTPSDTALFAATLTQYTKAWSVSIAITKGQRYAFGALSVGAATAPQVMGAAFGSSAELALGPRLAATIASLSDLPSSFTDAGLAVSTSTPYGVILP